MTIFARLAAAGLFAVVMGSQALAGDKLSGSDLMKLFPGQFMAVVKGYTVRIAAESNGVVKGSAMGQSDTGRWSVRGGQLCIAMNSWTKGKATCSAVVADAGWYRGQGLKFRKL